MSAETNLKRFIEAQNADFSIALSEIKQGRKESHWIWYIFPQIQGLGFSETSKYYAIKDLDEALEYLQHPVLGPRLIQICHTLLAGEEKNIHKIFGSPDDWKVQSSMTLFSTVDNSDPVFE